MRKLIGIIGVVVAFGLLGVPAAGAAQPAVIPSSGPASIEGTINVGPQPNNSPVEGGCKEGYICIWASANYSGQLSYWAEGNTGCKTHEAFHTFYSFFEMGHSYSATFGSAGRYVAHTGNATPGATTGNVCINNF